MTAIGQDTLKTRRTLTVEGKRYDYFSLPEAAKTLGDISRLPVSLKVLLENVLRFEDGRSYKVDDAKAIAGWLENAHLDQGSAVQARPHPDAGFHRRARRWSTSRRCATASPGWAATRQKVNPLVPVDLVIDHSVMVDVFATRRRAAEERRHRVRAQRRALQLPALGPGRVRQFPRRAAGHRHLPPGEPGISRRRRVDRRSNGGTTFAYPDTLYGTDSHTTMVNGLGILGWGVGGIEAEAAMLGQPIAMLIPDVIGFRLTGKLPEGATATDLVLTVTQMLRRKGVVGKFVEFFGPGLDDLALPDRATIGNMAPEYGATCGFFPVDKVRWTTCA